MSLRDHPAWDTLVAAFDKSNITAFGSLFATEVNLDEASAAIALKALSDAGFRIHSPDDEVVPMIKVGEVWLARPSTGWVEKYDENKHRLVCGGDDERRGAQVPGEPRG